MISFVLSFLALSALSFVLGYAVQLFIAWIIRRASK